MTAVLGILSVFAIALLLSSLFRRRIEQTLAPAVFAIVAVLYFFGLAGALYAGLLFVYCVAAGGLLFAIVRFIQKRAPFRELAVTPGIAIFGVWLVIGIFLSIGRVVSQWDALTHWGLVVKNMYYCDAFGNVAGAGSTFAEYPPGIGLFEYFLVRLSPSFSESTVYLAHNVLLFSLLAPALSRLKRWGFTLLLPAGLILLLLPLTSNTETYTNLYIDSTLGLLFADVLYFYFAQKRQSAFSAFAVAGGVFLLTLAKPSGAGMAAIALAILALDALFIRRDGKRNDWLALLAGVGALVLAKITWSAYLNANVEATMWNTAGRLTLPNLFASLRSPADWQKETISTFLRNICGHGVSRLLGISYLLWPVLLCLAALALPRRWKERFGKTRLRVLGFGLATGFLLYLGSLLASYLLVFADYEAVANASFERYASTMLLGAIGVFVFLALDLLLDEDANRTVFYRIRLLWALLAALLLIAPVHLADVRYFSKTEGEALRARYVASEAMGANRVPAGEPICYLSTEDSDRNDYCIARYNASPAKLVNGVFAPGMAKDDLAGALNGRFDYAYLDRIDDAFRAEYGALFVAGSEIAEHTLYRVVPQANGGVLLARAE